MSDEHNPVIGYNSSLITHNSKKDLFLLSGSGSDVWDVGPLFLYRRTPVWRSEKLANFQFS